MLSYLPGIQTQHRFPSLGAELSIHPFVHLPPIWPVHILSLHITGQGKVQPEPHHPFIHPCVPDLSVLLQTSSWQLEWNCDSHTEPYQPLLYTAILLLIQFWHLPEHKQSVELRKCACCEHSSKWNTLLWAPIFAFAFTIDWMCFVLKWKVVKLYKILMNKTFRWFH